MTLPTTAESLAFADAQPGCTDVQKHLKALAAAVRAILETERSISLEAARQACAAVMIKEGKTSTGIGAYMCEREILKLINPPAADMGKVPAGKSQLFAPTGETKA